MRTTKRGVCKWTLAVLTGLLAAAAQAAVTEPESHEERLIVTFQDGTGADERATIAREMGLSLVEDLDSLNEAVLARRGPIGAQDLSRAKRHPKVLAVEKDVRRHWLLDATVSFQGTVMPDVEGVLKNLPQPRRESTSGGDETVRAAGGKIPWGVARVDAPAAWRSGQGEGVKVAVIDTGIDCGHPDLRCKFSAGVNVIDPGRVPMDDNEHGTHVSGTIAGRGNDGGVLGVAPKAELVPIKVLDAQGDGALSDIVKGIDWAARKRVSVINMSLGTGAPSAALEHAVKAALDKRIVIVAAAGNFGPEADTVAYPARYRGVIAVAASDSRNRVASFSSRGDQVSYIAPGERIRSTVPGGGEAELDGTSMASPHVAGLAALAIERGAEGPEGVRTSLDAAAAPLCPEGSCLGPEEQGAGMIDAAKLR